MIEGEQLDWITREVYFPTRSWVSRLPDWSGVLTVSRSKELKRRSGIKRESIRPFWRPAPVRATRFSAFVGKGLDASG